jgi:hypothetical protein
MYLLALLMVVFSFVHELYDSVSAENRVIWVDWEDTPPSNDWLDEIKKVLSLLSYTRSMTMILITGFGIGYCKYGCIYICSES